MEQDIGYYGNDLNVGGNNKQADAEACRLSCRSIIGANYFGLVNQNCWCKSSDAGRMDKVGVVAGNVKCVVKNQGKNWEGKHLRRQSILQRMHYQYS